LDAILGAEAGASSTLFRLKRCVYRLAPEEGERRTSVVLKRLDAAAARRNELVARRWLPTLGLGESCPALLGVAAARSGRYVWHVYEDLGECWLDATSPDPRRVGAAVDLIARLHLASAEHPLLAECRMHGGDLGIPYFTSNLRDALRALEALRPSAVEMTPHRRDVRDRLLGRLRALSDERSLRLRVMEEAGGPEMLLHGDLWTINTFVIPTGDGARACLIDWDHAGVGPFAYDLSTLLYRFPSVQRPWLLDRYRTAVERAGLRLPDREKLNLLFDTAERARYANRAIWPAVALLHGDGAHWGFEELEEVDGWFEALKPALP
ncbi:MAG: aminoglycoside phosphotransferase family protein, partial [Planctomycetota bacterium]